MCLRLCMGDRSISPEGCLRIGRRTFIRSDGPEVGKGKRECQPKTERAESEYEFGVPFKSRNL